MSDLPRPPGPSARNYDTGTARGHLNIDELYSEMGIRKATRPMFNDLHGPPLASPSSPRYGPMFPPSMGPLLPDAASGRRMLLPAVLQKNMTMRPMPKQSGNDYGTPRSDFGACATPPGREAPPPSHSVEQGTIRTPYSESDRTQGASFETFGPRPVLRARQHDHIEAMKKEIAELRTQLADLTKQVDDNSTRISDISIFSGRDLRQIFSARTLLCLRCLRGS